jgi:hypothetical protein
MPVSLCAPHISNGLAWHRIRASEVTGRRPESWHGPEDGAEALKHVGVLIKYLNIHVRAFIGMNNNQHTKQGMYIKTGKTNFRFCVSVLHIASHQ